ncbi:c-type cytochrome [Azospirillum sp. sgz301742]
MKVAGIAIAAGVLLAGGPALAETAEEVAGRQVFNHCAACHALDPSKNAFGPSLIGVVGRKAGTLPRFEYSDAMRKSGITWTEANLRRWIADNEKVLPGTRMRHVSIKDRAEQDYLIAFIKSLK